MASVGSPNALRGRDATRGAAGRYGFVAEIARGYLGTLWVARDPNDHTATAFVRHVTPISSESARSSLLEATRSAIVAGAETLEVHEAKTGVDIVSPFEDGEVLRTLLRTAALRHTPPPAPVLLGIAAEIASQLHHQHTDGDGSLPVFGGLHADSVFIGVDGTVRLLDAGACVVASALEPWHSDPQRVGYFAPEQIDAKGTLDARTDVFSLGILLWEAFANRRLFPGNDARSARERVLRAPIPRLDATQKSAASGVSTPIANLVAQALSRDAAGRFASMEQMSGALGALDRASVEGIGEWVLALAGPVIEKRRQLLERTGTAHSAAQVASALVQSTPAPAAVAPPPASPPPELPPTPPQALEAEAPPSPAPQLPPTPMAAPVAARPLATPRAPEAVTEPAPKSEEPPPSAAPAGVGEAASTGTHSPENAKPTHGTALDAFFESPRPAVVASAGVAQPAAEAEPPAESVPPPERDDAEPSSETRSRADSEEAIDVGAEDLAASDAPPARKSGPPPPPSLKRPPRLPGMPGVTASTGAHAEEDVLGGESPSMASPIAVSQLGALTQKPTESRATWVIGAVAALLLGIGGILLLRGGGRDDRARAGSGAEHSEAPAAPANAVPGPPEPTPAPEPAAPEPPEPVAVAPVQVEASEPKAAPTPQEPKADAKAPERATTPAEKPKVASREGTAPAKPRSTPETGQHRPTPSRSAPGSTYKPGGI